jgi:4-aminobutyrate aminotransferase-like enzyme
MPDPLRICFFVNSGSEANELALRLARAHTRQRDLIVLDAAYHGNTTTLIDISPYKFNGPGGNGKPPWVHVVPVPDRYRGDFRGAADYADAVGQAIDELRADGAGLCGFIAESCPSVGGQIMFPPGYLAAVYRHVRDAGGVSIADEVQTAYGRIGTHCYAFEEQGVVPDIVVLGKPIGNGYPLGAVVTTPEIAASFDNGMEFFSTFGGSTVSCAVGLAVLDVVRDERLQAHARAVGDHLLGRLRSLPERSALVGDVRGSGLFIGGGRGVGCCESATRGGDSDRHGRAASQRPEDPSADAVHDRRRRRPRVGAGIGALTKNAKAAKAAKTVRDVFFALLAFFAFLVD